MAAAGSRRAARLVGDESGFTIVEVVVASLLLMVGALGVLQVFDASTRNNYRAEESQVLNNRLQAELEELKAKPYAEIAMTANLGHSSDPNNPRWRVSGASYAINRDGTQLREMVINGVDGVSGGTISPGPEPFTVGDISGHIYRFITWAPLTGCPACGGEALKRVVVAASIDEAPASFERSFQEVQTEVVDPDATPEDNPAPPADDDGDAAKAEFWLTDTPCIDTARQPIVADHPTHNTQGVCDDGLQNGSTPGAPDLMFTEAPVLDDAFPPGAQPTFDYATDVEPSENPQNDRGILLRKPSAPGCLLTGAVLDLPLTETNRHEKLHKWLAPPLPQGFELGLLGTGTLELYTRTLNGASHPGGICVWLFVRKLNALGAPVDVPVVSTTSGTPYFQFIRAQWPTTWTKVAVHMPFAGPGTVLPGERIGVAISVDGAETPDPAQGLEFMYDHPDFGSLLQLETDRVLPF